MSEPTEPGHPVGPEIDDSQNPTAATPDAAAAPEGEAGADQPEARDTWTQRQTTSSEILVQLQQMIDSMATQAGPVLRDVAAKAAELAAVAGERAGPLAHRAADATEKMGVRVAARSKEMAAGLRRPTDSADDSDPGQSAQ
jgi:hypothetical protein